MERNFQKKEELQAFLTKVANGQSIMTVYGNEFTLREGQPLAYETICEIGADEVEADFINEAVPSYPSSADFPVDGAMKNVIVHLCAHKSIAERCEYGKEGPCRYPWTMNTALNREKKEMQALVQWGVLIGLHSKQYSYIQQDMLFDTLCRHLTADFGEVEFAEGSYSEELTVARFEMKSFKASFVEMGLNGYPAVVFTTNDIADSAVNLQLELVLLDERDKKSKIRVRFGDKLSVTHNRGNGLSEFIENIEKLMSLIKDGSEKLASLKEIVISNPTDAFFNLCSEARIKELVRKKVIEDFEILTMGKETITAFDLYSVLWYSIRYYEEEGKSKASIISIEENLARTMHVRWSRIDVPYHRE